MFTQEAVYLFGSVVLMMFLRDDSEGWDYTIFDFKGNEIDGGVYDNPNLTIRKAFEEIREDYEQTKGDYMLTPLSVQKTEELIDEGRFEAYVKTLGRANAATGGVRTVRKDGTKNEG